MGLAGAGKSHRKVSDSDVQDRNLPEDNKDLEEIQKCYYRCTSFDGGFKDGEGPGMKRNMPGKGWPYGAFKNMEQIGRR